MNERPKPVLLYVLAALIFVEGVGLAAATVYLVIEIITQPHDSLASAIAYAVIRLLGGGAFLALCDAGARVVMAPAELPVGVLTALLGGPFFLWLLLLRRRQRS